MKIYSDISTIKGIGPKLKEKLNKIGIFTILDLLLYFPRDYENISNNENLEDIDEKEKRVLNCNFKKVNGSMRTKTGKQLTTLIFCKESFNIIAKWFNQPYIIRNFKTNENYNLLGKFKKSGNNLEVINPIVACSDALKSEIIAKYELKNALNNKILSKLINAILENIKIEENLPKYLISKYKLMDLDTSIRNIHFPKDKEFLNNSIRRLKFQELFTYSIKLMLLKENYKKCKQGISFKISDELKDLKKELPFELTKAQNKVVREILIDEKKLTPMNRLVQGDVGSGKTIVALIAIFNVYKNGYQTVLMAPTEILAYQHYIESLNLFKNFNIKIEFLVGSTSKKEKIRIKEAIKSGESIFVIGTHALIQDDVEFKNLGLVVTDEQHRFGVEQRSKLINKEKKCDVLVMTATPIPRTLTLYLYSDLDVSIIDKLPPGRKPIRTNFYKEENRDLAYKFAAEEIQKGRQVYIVCPLIEENEKMGLNSVEKLYDKLSTTIFKDLKIAILHGRMKAKEKDEVISSFKLGDIKVIISTTVIEVGVNVPNASVMIIENAERFGLSQLHQLRGRVGRGDYQSYCILISKCNNNITKKRMDIMTNSNDGFFIAEQDLKIRGTGDIFGITQHGENGLIISDAYADINILKVASFEAENIINNTDEKSIEFLKEISVNLERSSKFICFN